MNLPTGVSRVLAKNVKTFEARRELEELSGSSFSGYIIESLFGSGGLEESALLYRNGQGVGAAYDYYSHKSTLQGDGALPHVMNAFLAENGVVDIVELSTQQVDLVTAFNSKIKLVKPLAKGSFKPLLKDRFDPLLGQTIVSATAETDSVSKESLFKRFGLAGIDNH